VRFVQGYDTLSGADVTVQRIAWGRGCIAGGDLTHPAAFAIVRRLEHGAHFRTEDRTTVCEQPGVVEAQVGPWRLRFPAELRGTPGEVVPFTLQVLPNASAPNATVRASVWARLEHGDVPSAGASLPASVVVGSGQRIWFSLDEPGRSFPFAGPDVAVVPPADDPLAAPTTEVLRDAADVSEGLHAAADGRSLLVVYSMGTFRNGDCGENAKPVAFRAWRAANATQVVGFMSSGASDACMGGAAPHTPRVVAR